MSAPVDVLAVLDAAAKRLRLGVEGPRNADALDEARAAVVELIEANVAYEVASNEWPIDQDKVYLASNRVRAALARVQGGA